MLPLFYQISLKPRCALEPYRCCFQAQFLQIVLEALPVLALFRQSVGCTGWSEILKFGNLKAAGRTQEYYLTHPSSFWGRSAIDSKSRKVLGDGCLRGTSGDKKGKTCKRLPSLSMM